MPRFTVELADAAMLRKQCNTTLNDLIKDEERHISAVEFAKAVNFQNKGDGTSVRFAEDNLLVVRAKIKVYEQFIQDILHNTKEVPLTVALAEVLQ